MAKCPDATPAHHLYRPKTEFSRAEEVKGA